MPFSISPPRRGGAGRDDVADGVVQRAFGFTPRRALSTIRVLPNGSLAQLVEQRTLNPLVRGSSPRGPTKSTTYENPFSRYAWTCANLVPLTGQRFNYRSASAYCRHNRGLIFTTFRRHLTFRGRRPSGRIVRWSDKRVTIIGHRSRRRPPNLTSLDRFVLGLLTLFLKPHRIPKLSAILKSSAATR